MLDAGASRHGVENPMGWRALHNAVEWPGEAVVSVLLASGANVDAKKSESLHTP